MDISHVGVYHCHDESPRATYVEQYLFISANSGEAPARLMRKDIDGELKEFKRVSIHPLDEGVPERLQPSGDFKEGVIGTIGYTPFNADGKTVAISTFYEPKYGLKVSRGSGIGRWLECHSVAHLISRGYTHILSQRGASDERKGQNRRAGLPQGEEVPIGEWLEKSRRQAILNMGLWKMKTQPVAEAKLRIKVRRKP